MDLLINAKEKLEELLKLLEMAHDYTKDIKKVLASFDDGLQFTKKHYSELNALTMAQTQNLKGSDIYFYFMRFTHQFFNVMNIIQTLPNASYYEKFSFLLEARQKRFEELRLEAITKGQEILNK